MSTASATGTRDNLGWGELNDPNDYSKGKNYPLHDKQMECLNSESRFTAAIAGTGGGKTVTGPIWCAKQIERAVRKYGRCVGMVIAPTYKVLSRATMPCLVETFKYTQFEGIYKESKSQYVLPNDLGVIWCQGADNPGGLEGGQFDFVWGDEGGQFKTKTYHAIEGRTGAKLAPILITTTPYGLGYLHDNWYANWKAGDVANYKIVQWASIKNPGYPMEEYERQKKNLSPEKFAERYDGSFMRLEGLCYPTMFKSFVTMGNDDLKTLLRSSEAFFGGLDYGWNDPFCGLNGALTSDDVLWIWFERYKSETTMPEHIKHLPMTYKYFGKETMWASEHDPENIKLLKKAGFKVVKAKKDIKAGIMAVNARIHQSKLKIIINRCPAIEGESEKYRYPDKDEEIVGDKPIDKDNHAMDALRYMIMLVDRKKVY